MSMRKRMTNFIEHFTLEMLCKDLSANPCRKIGVGDNFAGQRNWTAKPPRRGEGQDGPNQLGSPLSDYFKR